MATEPTYDFTINGLDLTSNATRIQLHKRNMNSYGHVLRQSAPVAHRSGKSHFVVSVELAFPNHEEINNKLRHLIAHFKVSPFAQLDSKYASRAAFPSEAEAATFAATLSNLSIYTVPNAPESLFANLDLMIFNHAPYSPDFSFKTETTPEGAVKKTYKRVEKIHQSSIYKKAFDNIVKSIPKVTERTNHNTDIIYNQYIHDFPPVSGELKDEDLYDIGKTLFFADTDDVVFEGQSSKMHRDAVGNFKQIARVYRKRTGKRLPVSNMFLSALDIDFYYSETEKDILDDHRAGIAFDVAMYDRGLDGVQALKYLYLRDKDYETLVEIAGDYGFIANKDKPWHFSLSTTAKSVQDIIRDNHSVGAFKTTKKNVLDYGDYIKIYNDFLQEKKSKGLFPTNVANIWKQETVETIDKRSKAVAVTSINISLTHDVTSIPILGYEYPTAQYLGGKHSKAILALEGLRHDQIDKIKLGLNTTNNNENDFKRARDHNILTIANPILSLVGLRHCVVDSTESSTVPGSPDMDIFVFSATQHDPWFKETLSQEQISGSKAAKTSVFKVIKKHLNQYVTSIEDDAAKMGVTSTYNSGSPNYSALLSSYTDRVANALNDFLRNSKIHKDYSIGDLYGLGSKVQSLIDSRPYPQKTEARFLTEDESKTIVLGNARHKKAVRTVRGYRTREKVEDKSIDLDLISDLYNGLSKIFWNMIKDGVLDLDEFKFAKKEFSRLKKQSLTQCYPDMKLPATVTSDPIDTDPDYFFWKEDSETSYVNTLIADAVPYARNFLALAEELGKEAKKGNIKSADADVGASAINGHMRPKKTNDSSDYFKIADEIKKAHKFDQVSLRKMLDTLVEQAKEEEVFTMNRAHPTYKVYFIEEDEDEEFSIVPTKSFDDFFGYNAVHDIKIVRSRKVPADLCIISMSNLSGNLTSSAKYNTNDLDKFYETQKASKDTASENPIDALILRPGQKIQVRLGYSNNPDNLEIVFNGQIVEVGGTHNVTIVCQSFATELVQQIKGIETPEALVKAKDKVTGGILANLMQSPEVKHFGSRKKGLLGATLLKSYKDISSEGNTLYGVNLDPRDDNIFPPNIETYLANNALLGLGASWSIHPIEGLKDTVIGAVSGLLATWWAPIPGARVAGTAVGAGAGATSFIKKYTDLDYKLFHTTIWDVFKEMELRHPGWIASPVPYGDRMTMFFGVPDMGYWSRPETHDEYIGKTSKRKKMLGDTLAARTGRIALQSLTEGKHGPFLYDINANRRTWSDPAAPVITLGTTREGPSDPTYAARVALAGDRFKPFRRYHYLADKVNIVANDIRVNSDVYNAVTVQYTDDVTDDIDEYGNVNYEIGNTKTFKIHGELRDEDVNLLFSPQPNCEGKWMAARYAQGLLLRHMKDVYTGSITVLGNPKIKPYDVCQIFDDITDMYGAFEVEQVVHHFSKETGFITEIVPDLILSANQYATISLTKAMSQIGFVKYAAIGAMITTAGKVAGPSIIRKITGQEKPPSILAEKTARATVSAINAGKNALDKGKSVGKNALKSAKNVVELSKASDPLYAAKKTGQGAYMSAKESLPKLLKGVSNLKDRKGNVIALTNTFKDTMRLAYRAGGTKAILIIGTGILYGLGSYYITKDQELQPIFVHPLIVNRVPFISGMEGIRSTTLYSAWMERFALSIEESGDAWDAAKDAIDDIVGEIIGE